VGGLNGIAVQNAPHAAIAQHLLQLGRQSRPGGLYRRRQP
jgi:hypothetical protein